MLLLVLYYYFLSVNCINRIASYLECLIQAERGHKCRKHINNSPNSYETHHVIFSQSLSLLCTSQGTYLFKKRCTVGIYLKIHLPEKPSIN